MIDTRYRTDAEEMMDDFAMEGEILRDALDKIAKINQILGGNKLTLQGVKQLLKNNPKEDIRIIDIGCGNGDMLRSLADYAAANGLKFTLIGIDANLYTVNHAKNLSVDYPNISYQCEDIFDASFTFPNYDIALCTLTLHHFRDDEILDLMNLLKDTAKLGLVINDLHRSATAYYLFQALCFVFGLNEMSRKDGLVSILRGFKREDLEQYSTKLKLKNYTLHWKWAFRYQWIISTI